MGNRHIKIISALRFLLPFAQAECSPLEVCLKGTFKTQSQTFVWLFFFFFLGAPSMARGAQASLDRDGIRSMTWR
ncbi:Uncharacterised protein [Brucella anthropi]|nr:Uncharacterised protein [Brucella anthropi]